MDENSHAFVYLVAHDAERNKDGDDKNHTRSTIVIKNTFDEKLY